MRRLIVLLAGVAVAFGGSIVLATPAAALCDKESERRGECETGGGDDDGGGGTEQPRQPQPGDPWTEESLQSPCSPLPPGENPGDLCGLVYACPNDEETNFAVWLRDHTYNGSEWEVTSDPEWYRAEPHLQCRDLSEEDEITEEDVWAAVVEFGLPAGQVEMNPVGARTLVRFDSIFYTEAETAEFTLPVGQTDVQIRATPSRFYWDFGEAQDETTHPGVPWSRGTDPSAYVMYAYQSTGTYDVSVDVAYTVEWNAGDGWQTISEPILGAESEPASIVVLESQALLRDR